MRPATSRSHSWPSSVAEPGADRVIHRHRLLLALFALAVSSARAHAQHFGLELDRDSVKLGEVVVLRARIHIGPQQTLASPVPVAAEGLPDGARIIGVDSLQHQQDRTLLIGSVRMAFLRTGRLRIPPLRVIVKATPDDRGFPLESEPLYVDVVPSLPAGSPALKDIRDQLPVQQVDPFLIAVAVAAGAAALWAARRRLARRPASVSVPVAIAGPDTPADIARAALSRIEREGWAERGDVARHYEAIVGVMRHYLASIDPKVHAAQTSTELLHVLATRRSNGTWHATARVFGDADLVKFAGVSPDAGTARAFTAAARRMVDAWASPGEHG